MYRLLLICACLFLAWGCGSQRKAQSSQSNKRPPLWENRPAQQPIPEVLMPEERMPASVSTPATVATAIGTVHQERPVAVPAVMPADEDRTAGLEFEYDETQHVSIVKADPRPGEMLVVSLSQIGSQFVYPCDGQVISPYGKRGGRTHTGVDIKAHAGDTIRAAFAGVVRMSKSYADYGNIVVIRHACGLETLYGHNSRNLVKVNDRVVQGQAIALAGRTGRATTEHLHFEIRAAGKHFDPSMVVDHATRSLHDDVLYIYNKGDRLLVLNTEQAMGYATDKKPATSPSTDAGPKNAPPATEKTTYQVSSRPETSVATTHIVAKGEVLSAIAARYHTSVDQLCRWNGIARNSVLRIGQKIVVAGPTDARATGLESPVGSQTPQSTASPAQARESIPDASTASVPEFHTVGKGETLFAIARRFGLTLDELCRLNDIRDPDKVTVGQRLRLRNQAAPPSAR